MVLMLVLVLRLFTRGAGSQVAGTVRAWRIVGSSDGCYVSGFGGPGRGL